MTVIFQTTKGFVTDTGFASELRDEEGSLVTIVPRYGVWQRSGNKFEITMTTHDRDMACATVAGGQVIIELEASE